MNELQDLHHWSVGRLAALKPKELLSFTRRALGALTVARILFGRCLLAITRTGAAELQGYSGAIHFAIHAGMGARGARESRRVARCLEELPRLRQAAENGELYWSAAREITRSATPETEERWLELARECTCEVIEKLVARTPRGERPGEPDKGPTRAAEVTELRVLVPVELMAMVQQTVRDLSRQARRRLSMVEVLELVFAEHQAGGGLLTASVLKKLRTQARKDVAARREAEQRELDLATRSAACAEPDPGGSSEPAGKAEGPVGQDSSAEHDPAGSPAEPTGEAQGQVSQDSSSEHDPAGSPAEPTGEAQGQVGQDSSAEHDPAGSPAEPTGEAQGQVSQDSPSEHDPVGSPAEPTGEAQGQVSQDSSAEHDPAGSPDETSSDGPMPPWAAVGADERPCPGGPQLQLVTKASPPHWANSRLDFGAGESRLPTSAQRVELNRRDAYRCSTPGCPHHLWLAVHHLVFYCQGGVTVPENLVVVCSRCHRNIHRGRLRVSGQAPGGLHWTNQAGEDLRRPPTGPEPPG